MVTVLSGQSSDHLIVNPTSNAIRQTFYDARGNVVGQKATYSACVTNTNAASASVVLFSLNGSSERTIRLLKVTISITAATTAVYKTVQINKTLTATTGGTATAITRQSYDQNNPSSLTGFANFYTANPTAGTVPTLVASQLAFLPITGTPVINPPIVFDFSTSRDETEAHVLRNSSRCFEISLNSSVGTVPTCNIWVEWAEE